MTRADTALEPGLGRTADGAAGQWPRRWQGREASARLHLSNQDEAS